MAKDKGSGGCGSAGFILLLIALSALAIWYAEEERPRQEVAGLTATVSVRRATAQARRTATAVALDSRVHQTATANAPTAHAQRTGTARSGQTATTRAGQTSTAQARQTATEQAQRTATAQSITATARARQTATALLRHTATAHSQQTGTAVAPTTFVRHTVTARAQASATTHAQLTATVWARPTITVAARRAATAIALEYPDIQIEIQEVRSDNRLQLEARSNLRFGGRLEVAVHDYSEDVKKSYVVTFSTGQRGFIRLSSKFIFTGHPIRRKNQVEGLEVIFKTLEGERSRLICVKSPVSSTATYDRYSCNRERGSFVSSRTAPTLRARMSRTASAQQAATAREQRKETAVAPTSFTRQTATAHVRQWATFYAQRTATAVAPTTHVRQTATAIVRQTATARAQRTATAAAPTTYARQTSTAQVRQTATAQGRQTATARARRTVTESYQQTATARARPTRTPRPTTYYVQHSGPVNIRACASTECARVGTLPSGTAIRVFWVEDGAEWNGDIRWLAFDHQGQTRYLHVLLATRIRPTNTPRPTRTPRPTATTVIRLQAAETYYVISRNANARPCPQHLDPGNPCSTAHQFNYRDSVTVVGEARGDVYQGSTLWKVIEHGNRRLFIHATLLSRNQPVPSVEENPGGSSGAGNNSSSGRENSDSSSGGGNQRANIRGCNGRTNAYISGYCTRVKRISGQCGFPRGDPNYTSERDRDGDGCACEC